jgi:hypothetical protein
MVLLWECERAQQEIEIEQNGLKTASLEDRKVELVQ